MGHALPLFIKCVKPLISLRGAWKVKTSGYLQIRSLNFSMMSGYTC